MNTFLKNGRSSSKKNSSILKLRLNTSRNRTNRTHSLIKSKNNFFMQFSKETLKKLEILKTEYNDDKKIKINKYNLSNIEMPYVNQNLINPEINNILNNHKSNKSLNKINDSFDNNNNINKDNNKNNNNLQKNISNRNSVYIKEYPNLNKIYELSPKSQRIHHLSSLNENENQNPFSQETFFTSIPIDPIMKKFNNKENISKRTEMTSLLTTVPQLKSKRNYYNNIHLKELKSQVRNFENSKNFDANEKKIKKFISAPDRFINKKFSTKVEVGKRIKLKVDGKSKIFAKNNETTIPHIRPRTSRTLYKIMDDLQKESEENNDKVMKIKYDYNYDKTDRVLKNVLNGNDLWNTDLNNYLKKITLDYKKNMGEFTFYRNRGIFASHRDNLIKNEKLLAFMVTNELFE